MKSPLRYPGGKSKAIKKLVSLFPNQIKEYREPFLGGGSLFLYIRQNYPEVKCWVNDLNPNVYAFWKAVQEDLEGLTQEIKEYKRTYKVGRELYTKMKTHENLAVRFYILNRITYGGMVDCAGYSETAFTDRFTDHAIDNLLSLRGAMDGVLLTNEDYSELMKGDTKAFIYLDPPYYSATKSKLYGKNGVLHSEFDHERFLGECLKSKHNCLISYDDCEYTREGLKGMNMESWELQYSIKVKKGKEICFWNYPRVDTQEKTC